MGTAIAFLQARMGSTRLPGKVMLRIGGRSILERAIRRLRAARALDDVAVLTTTLEEDDEVATEARRLGVLLHRGPELDVLRRFAQAIERFHPEVVVRATADNPLIDIGSTERIVRSLRASGLDYCGESGLPVGAATEAVTAAALRRVDREAREEPHREHVTLYIREKPDRFRLALLTPPDRVRHPHLRLTVDTPEDFVFMEDLIASVPEPGDPPPLERYLEYAMSLARARA